jgi:hypothetical protein
MFAEDRINSQQRRKFNQHFAMLAADQPLVGQMKTSTSKILRSAMDIDL